MSKPYGVKGCTCFKEHGAGVGLTWYPNASCQHHGVLAPYTPPRRDTGTYRVVSPSVSPQQDEMDVPYGRPPSRCTPGVDCGGMYDACATGPGTAQTTEEGEQQRGLRAAIRRWSRGGYRVFTGWRN